MTQYISADLFNLHLLQAISDWQRGGDTEQNLKRGKILKEACSRLPKKYRTCALVCFRQIALPKKYVFDIIGENLLREKISSWTVDLQVAQEFKSGVPPEGQGFQGLILSITPQPSNVIINLNELFREKKFVDALTRHRESIQGYVDGIGRYMGTQSEVVLELAAVTQEDIYSLGGHSSPFESLVTVAADGHYGRKATDEERKILSLNSKHLQDKAGPRWLTPEATARVIAKMKIKTLKLLESKKSQN